MNNDESQTRTSNHYARRVLLPVIVVLTISALVILYGNRVYDHFAAARFSASSEVAVINQRLKLTGLGHDLFYASKPVIQTGQAFNQSCQTTERTAAILGCYFKRDIFLYNVTNPQLDGAKEVTAAHEMLHAAYDRLNAWERSRVDSMLEKQYELVKDRPDIKKLMAYYETNEPGERNNELHSILGTTLSDLSPDLEKHYQQYFMDRSSIVAMNTKYNTVFNEVEARANELSHKIDTEGEPLQSDLKAYESERTLLASDIQAFNERAKGGYYTSNSAFQVARQALVTRSDRLEAERIALNQRVADYNAMIAELKDLSVKVDNLNSSINGATSPAPGV